MAALLRLRRMHKLLPFLITGLALLAPRAGTAAADPQRVSVSIDVKPAGSGGETKSSSDAKAGTMGATGYGTTNSKTDQYSSTRVHQSGLTLDIEARNLGAAGAHVMIDWVFLQEPANGKGEMSGHGRGQKELDILPGGTLKLTADSGPVTSKTTKHLALKTTGSASTGQTQTATGSTTVEGNRLKGWIVRLHANGGVAQVRASGPAFEAIGKNDAQFSRYAK